MNKLPERLPFYDWATTCDQCKRPRNRGNHQRCSRLRQRLAIQRGRKAREAGHG